MKRSDEQAHERPALGDRRRLPAAVFLSGCPDQCAPTQDAAPALELVVAAAAEAAPQPPRAEPLRPRRNLRRAQTPTTRATGAPAQNQAPPAGLMFSEDFASAAAFSQRFDHGWSGQDPATWPANANPKLSWLGDHDASCGNPAETSRTVTITPGAAGKEGVFYACLPGGDPAKGHVMTSMNTEGYNIAWFSRRSRRSTTCGGCVGIRT